MAAVAEAAAAAAARKRLADEAGSATTACCSSPAHARGLEEPERTLSAAHIRVSVRVRPVPPGDDSIIEVAGLGAIAVRKEAGTGGNEFLKSQRGRTEERMFDRVFGPEATQAAVYEWSCQPLITSAVEEGRSATVFVYGATSAGKTHTMFGEREGEQQGMIYRSVQEVFDLIAARARARGTRPLEAKLSFLDIYNENVRDLLQEGNALCKVLEDERRGVVKVANLREVPVRSAEEVLKQLRIGLQARKVEATAANQRSSRSHAVFQLTLERVEAALPGPGNPIFGRRGAEQRRLHSCISLIDLAGSERATQTLNRGSALKDGAKINQSLLALANCIDALVYRPVGREGCQTPRRKPPYRDSKLTLLLKGSLMSDCLVSMIANVHPGRDHFEDSNNTLEYAKRASAVKAPVVVRRPRAVSLPTSRPPSESPPPSPSTSDRILGPRPATPPPPGPPDVSDGVSDASGRAQPLLPKRRRTLEGRPPAGARTAPGDCEAASARLRAAASEEQLLPTPGCARALSATARPGRSAPGEAPERPSPRHSSCNARLSRRLSHSSECSSGSNGETSAFNTPHGSEAMSLRDADASPRSDRGGQLHRTPASPLRISPRGTRCGARAAATRGTPREESSTPATLPASSSSSERRLPPAPAPAAAEARHQSPASGSRVAPRPARHAASPRAARHQSPALQSPAPSRRHPRGDCGADAPCGLGAVGASPGGAGTSQHAAMLLRIIDTLQADKVSLDSKICGMRGDRDRLEAENAQLRAANLEKDRQIAVLIVNWHSERSRRGQSPPAGSTSRSDLSPCVGG